MANHLSKLKNVWDSLNKEMSEGEKVTSLPEILLICKILDTLPPNYFSFKASWRLMSEADRTIDNLTSQLCAHEGALRIDTSSQLPKNEEALALSKPKNVHHKYKTPFICNYCKKEGHIIRNCIKWKKDGRPPKSNSINNNQSDDYHMILSATSNLVFTSECDNFNWFVDNGATNHVCNNKNLFKFVQPFDRLHQVITANGENIPAAGFGDVEIKALVKDNTVPLTLSNVWYVPQMHKNLFSVLSAQDKNVDSKFVSSPEKCKLIVHNNVILTGEWQRHGGLFKLGILNDFQVNLVSSDSNLLQLYHERLAHQNKKHVKNVIEREFNIKVNLDSELCEGCMFGKAHRLKFGTKKRASAPGEIFHTDLCGPFERSISGFRYYLLFKDDFTRYRFIYFIKEKAEVPQKFLELLGEVSRAGHKVQTLMSDNGGEFDNKLMKDILKEHNIKQQLTMPYCPEMNGFIERENRTVLEAARTMLHSRNDLPQSLWAELTNYAVYVLNRSAETGVDGKTPFELWFSRKSSIKHLRIIGSDCYVHIPKQNRKKMDKKSTKGILVGYDYCGYRIWNPQRRTIIRSRDVIFNEAPKTSGITVTLPTEKPQKTENQKEENSNEMKNPQIDRQAAKPDSIFSNT